MKNPVVRVGDDRPVVWTVSENDSSKYCLYIRSRLAHEDLSFEEFYPLYKSAVAQYST